MNVTDHEQKKNTKGCTMRKKSALVLIVLLIAILVVGCGNSTNQTTTEKVFTLEELTKYNGKNGSPAYIAANGIVYDVSKSKDFVDGVHRACPEAVAGTDVTAIMSGSPHQSSKGLADLDRLPKVGTLNK